MPHDLPPFVGRTRSPHALARASAWASLGCLALLLGSCTSRAPAPQTVPPVQVPSTVQLPASTVPAPSQAANARAYRQDAARHLYARYPQQIHHGPMQPLLYAIGVLNVKIDSRGRVIGLEWMRAPRHAPEVMAQIETMVRAAAPFPAPQRLGSVTYTDVWLWDKSGRWQLDTLTEGQL